MEEIIQYVIDKLANRETKTLTLSSKENFFDSKRTIHYFINYKQIIIKDIGVVLLKKIMAMDEKDEVVSFIYSALDYGCVLSLQLSFDAPFLIDWSWLSQTPFTVLNHQKKMYLQLPKRFITYADVAVLDTTTILIILEGQRLTNLAKEKLAEEAIEYIEKE